MEPNLEKMGIPERGGLADALGSVHGLKSGLLDALKGYSRPKIEKPKNPALEKPQEVVENQGGGENNGIR